jgi:hypothetical protein
MEDVTVSIIYYLASFSLYTYKTSMMQFTNATPPPHSLKCGEVPLPGSRCTPDDRYCPPVDIRESQVVLDIAIVVRHLKT